jgi:hypothetical protein
VETQGLQQPFKFGFDEFMAMTSIDENIPKCEKGNLKLPIKRGSENN